MNIQMEETWEGAWSSHALPGHAIPHVITYPGARQTPCFWDFYERFIT